MKKRIVILLLLLTGLILAAGLWLLWDNLRIVTTCYLVEDSRIPTAFHGYRIAQISDLHNAEFGEDNSRLLQALADGEPDIIVITGDLVDRHHGDMEVAIDFAARAAELAPVYYVAGNHEADIGADYAVLKAALQEVGVCVLENEVVTLEKDGETLLLAGLRDYYFEEDWSVFGEYLEQFSQDEGFTVLLCHRPEYFRRYATLGYELVLCGHAHGGQVRLPWIGGVLAPDQGFWPPYDAGIFQKDGTRMIVSRGLGNSLFPIRFNNPPELVIAELSPST